MSTEQMRDEIIDAYPGYWPLKVLNMPDAQIASTYSRILNKSPERLKSNKKTLNRSSK